jgi:hypothetical protein
MSKQTLRLDGPPTHFSSATAVMQVFRAAATGVEFILSSLIAAYCLALFVYLRGVTSAFKTITSVFKSSAKSHKSKQ